MREKKIFIYLVIIWFTLLGIYIFLEKAGMKFFETKKQVQKITIKEAQHKIDRLLSKTSITFPINVSNLETNSTLNRVVSVLKNVNSNIFVNIEVHSDVGGKSSKNRILSQKQADTILSFIKKEYPLVAIDAIGYGEEYPLDKKVNINNKRIEIRLQALIPKI